MGLRARILKVTALDGGGPRSKNVLRSLARNPVQVAEFAKIFDAMLDTGELRKYSDRRQAVYGPPGLRRRGGTWVEVAHVKPHREFPGGVLVVPGKA